MSWLVKSHKEWSDYIARGRSKYDRTLYDRGYRVRFADKFNKASDIQIYSPWLPDLNMVTVHLDGTMTIDGSPTTTAWGYHHRKPMNFWSNKYTLWKYAGMTVNTRNFELRITERDPALTPSRIQKCRACNGTGKFKLVCYSFTCYNSVPEVQDNQVTMFSCKEHSYLGARRWHDIKCEHGHMKPHTYFRVDDCWKCRGYKQFDYGNKPVTIPWDGSPIKVQDGKVLSVVTNTEYKSLERLIAEYV